MAIIGLPETPLGPIDHPWENISHPKYLLVEKNSFVAKKREVSFAEIGHFIEKYIFFDHKAVQSILRK